MAKVGFSCYHANSLDQWPGWNRCLLEGQLKAIMQITMNEDDRIARLYMMVNPDKLAHLQKENG